MNTEKTMTCPRRSEDGMTDPGSSFVGAGEKLDTYRDDSTCSYCGSFNPDTLMARIEAGDVEIGPTDKGYKAYVRNIGGEAFKQTYRQCPPEERKIVDGKEVTTRCAGPDTCTHWVTREREETKFYFQHLSVDQKKRFVELLNEKKIQIGYPGHFYVRPFFIAKPV